MALRTRIAISILALAFGLAPALAMAADCVGCCCPPTPCHQIDERTPAADCGSRSFLEASMGCCNLEPATAPAPGLRAFQASAELAALPHPIAPQAPAAHTAAPLRAGPAEPLVSPLRLSVVRRN